ncbi:MAG: ADP-forming succinate--CoA ligase subunit beta [Deltaproteobacteria bacterium]|nr:ADP-forming succinate--CoA ligase subunit beta [Deltaproteobacteria bacterium]
MKLHEYQAKALLKRFGVRVPDGEVADSVAAVRKIATTLGGTVVVKAQIHAGGRGKGGGIKVAKTPDEASAAAEQMLGMRLVTPQTGPQGRRVKKVLVERGSAIARELYLGLVLDRATGRVTIMTSSEGGVEIEEVAARSPEKILKVAVDPAVGFQGYQGRQLAFGLGLLGNQQKAFVRMVSALYDTYMNADCSLAEINPLVVTADGELLPLDGKITLDDNALYRHKDLEEWRDLDEEDPAELEATAQGLSYIPLDGTIGCMVNGAGLAMATMDIIKLCGGEPANFLDVGGSASREAVAKAFDIILRDAKVEAILVNIFGGIMKCDVIAEGILAAAAEVQLRVPVVVRLQGTHVDRGRAILAGSALRIDTAERLDEAAEKVVRACQGSQSGIRGH